MSEKQCDGLIYEVIADIREIIGVGMTPMLSELAGEVGDKIDGLESDLENAVETAYNRGATEWCKSNYPHLYDRFNK